MKLKDKILGSLVPGFDPGLYPRTYLLTAGWRAWWYAVAALLGGGGLAFAAGLIGTPAARTPGATAGLLGLCLLAVAIGVLIVLDVQRAKIVLLPDAIEKHQLLGVQHVKRVDIAGRRRSYSVLVTRRAGAGSMKLPREIGRDAAFRAWIESLPDLDQIERRAAEAAVAADQALGTTPAQRLQRLAQARKTAVVLNLAALLATFWAVLYPHPYDLAVAAVALIPPAAITLAALRSKFYSLDLQPPPLVAPLLLALVLPGFGLLLRALDDVHLLGWQAPAALAVAGGLVLGAIAAAADPLLRQRGTGAVALAVLLGAYGCGLGLELDFRADHAPPGMFPVQVLGKQVAYGRRYRGWEFSLAPWGPRTSNMQVPVARGLFESVQAGDTVCVGLHAGAIGIAWYAVSRCP